MGKLLASLYGTRDASANCQEEVAKCMKEWGYVTGLYNPCMCHHPSRDILCLVHGDDFVAIGPTKHAASTRKTLEDKYRLKVELLGKGEGEKEGSSEHTAGQRPQSRLKRQQKTAVNGHTLG